MVIWKHVSPRLVFLELFAGVGHVAQALRKAGHAAVAFDILQSPLEDHCSADFKAVLKGWLSSRAIAGVWLGTPCTTWSQALRKPLRSRRRPLGLPGLSDSERQRLRVGSATFKFTIWVIELCIAYNIPVLLENPATSIMWHARALRPLLSHNVVRVFIPPLFDILGSESGGV